MEQFEQAILGIKRDENYLDQIDILEAMITDEQGTCLKTESKKLIETLGMITEDPSYSPHTKFYAIMVTVRTTQIAKEFVNKKYAAFINAMLGSPLFQMMVKLGSEVDPQKKVPIRERTCFRRIRTLGIGISLSFWSVLWFGRRDTLRLHRKSKLSL